MGPGNHLNTARLDMNNKAGEKKPVSLRLETLKRSIELVAALLYGIFLSLTRRNHRRVVIYYHSLAEKDVGNFQKQMMYLSRKCHVVKASEIMIAPPNRVKVIVGVTFDDAFTSFRDNALRILQEYRLPASVFAPTSNLGKSPSWAMEEDCSDAHEIIMNEEQLAELDKLGYEMLSHTVSHPDLTEIDDIKLGAELEQSKQTLERIVGHDVLGISYPYGSYDDRICKAAEQAGYRIGFSIEPCSVDVSSDNLRIGRFKVSPMDSMLKFKLKVSGAYEVVKYFRRLKRMLFQP